MDNDHINLNRREQQTNTVEAMDTEDGTYGPRAIFFSFIKTLDLAY